MVAITAATEIGATTAVEVGCTTTAAGATTAGGSATALPLGNPRVTEVAVGADAATEPAYAVDLFVCLFAVICFLVSGMCTWTCGPEPSATMWA
mmetsp:Transcript_45139/g.91136  ORF Transcript_45139/g.91136 Transcript_45139/m.91136 type:complete len:94 (+) Transcript_45139:1617-1898(+)